MLKKILYQKNINKLIRTSLKPFSGLLPDGLKIPVNGVFTVKGNQVPEFKMTTNPTNAVTKFLYWGNVEGFEFNSVRVFCEVVKHSKVFFDIGSNIGYYSLLASAIKKKDISVFAFEPMPSAYGYLVDNIALNNFTNIQAKKLALSDQKGEATFFSVINPKFPEMQQLTGDGGLSQSHSGNLSKVNFKVEIDTLDNFVKENLKDLKIDLIKLDTEANEHKVLAGSQVVLSQHRPIIQCEILKNQIEVELEAILSKHKYLYFRATDKGLVPVKTFLNNTSGFVDYYLVPEEKKDRVLNFIISG